MRSRACLESVTVSIACPRETRCRQELTIRGEERNGRASRAGTTSTSDSVDVILRVIGVIVVQHMGNVPNVLIAREKERG